MGWAWNIRAVPDTMEAIKDEFQSSIRSTGAAQDLSAKSKLTNVSVAGNGEN